MEKSFQKKQNKNVSEEDKREHLNGEIDIRGNGMYQYADIKTSTIITLYEQLVVITEDGPQTLTVKITSDFDEIPKKYHEIFLNMMTSKYYSKANFGNNPFSECKPIKRKKWWQFWKNKYFTD